MPRLPWTKKYKLLPSSKKWTIRINVSFPSFFWRIFHVSTQQARTLVEAHTKKKKKDLEEENSVSESDDARFRHPSNDKKNRKIGVAIRLKRMKEEVKA